MRFLTLKYLPFTGLLLFLLAVYFILIPESIRCCDPGRYRAIVASFLLGALMGSSEIASRYRDEPLKAIRSPFGLTYVVINGFISILALFFIFHFSSFFGTAAQDNLKVTLLAGFGAAAVMRTRVVSIKGRSGEDISVGPDYVINILMGVINTGIDRWRAVRREEILKTHYANLIKLGDFATAWSYLLASLLAFQNLDEAVKKNLIDTYNEYQATKYPDDIKRLGLGFLFLTLVGESNFGKVLESAVAIKAAAEKEALPTSSTTLSAATNPSDPSSPASGS